MSQSCSNCQNVKLESSITSLEDYLTCLHYLKTLIANDGFHIGLQSCDIDRVQDESGTWCADTVFHVIECDICGRPFELYCDTYHGNGSFIQL